jgi:tetratricopeptide (TPR) repeat protein
LDRGNGSFVWESLDKYKEIFESQNDENLLADWEIMECRALQQLEKVEEAKEKYESLCKIYPENPRPFLYLAEHYLNSEDYNKCDELLKDAERIDSDYWLLQLEKAQRDHRLGKKIDAASIDEKNFPSDPKVKSNYYRFYSAILYQQNDFSKAESFIEKAIRLNPDRLANYFTKWYCQLNCVNLL